MMNWFILLNNQEMIAFFLFFFSMFVLISSVAFSKLDVNDITLFTTNIVKF